MEDNTKESSNKMPHATPEQQYQGQEGENHSTAAEGTLKSPDEATSFGTTFNEAEEQDLDDVVHSASAEGAQNGDASTGGQTTPLNEENKFTPDDISS